MQVFILIPGTPSNLGVYVSWYCSRARQAGVSLPEHTSGALKVTIDAGDTLFIPGREAVLLLARLCARSVPCCLQHSISWAIDALTCASVSAAGWVFAEMAAEDAVALRGHYLHLTAVQRHLEAARIEEHLDLAPAMRFPCFYEVLPLLLLCASLLVSALSRRV